MYSDPYKLHLLDLASTYYCTTGTVNELISENCRNLRTAILGGDREHTSIQVYCGSLYPKTVWGDTEATLRPIGTVLSLVCHQAPEVLPNCRDRVVRSAERVYRATQKCSVRGS